MSGKLHDADRCSDSCNSAPPQAYALPQLGVSSNPPLNKGDVMFAFRSSLACTALVLFVISARGEYAAAQLEKVPVERLTKNLEDAVKKNPKDASAVLNLARVHAMAYSLRSEEVSVEKRNPNSPWFGYEPAIVPFNKLTKTEDKDKLKAAEEHLKKAITL